MDGKGRREERDGRMRERERRRRDGNRRIEGAEVRQGGRTQLQDINNTTHRGKKENNKK